MAISHENPKEHHAFEAWPLILITMLGWPNNLIKTNYLNQSFDEQFAVQERSGDDEFFNSEISLFAQKTSLKEMEKLSRRERLKSLELRMKGLH